MNISTPTAYASHSPAALDDLSSSLTSLLTSAYTLPSLLPPNLSIIPHKKSWTISVDALVLSDGGNVLDVLFLAAKAAMHDFCLPVTRSVEYKAPSFVAGSLVENESGLDTRTKRVGATTAADFDLADYWSDGEPLPNRGIYPVGITLNLLDELHYLDSTPLEAAATPAKLFLAFSFEAQESNNRSAKLVLTHFLGEKGISFEQLQNLVKVGEGYADALWKSLDEQLRSEDKKRAEEAARYR